MVNSKLEYGDFQTPNSLTREVCFLLRNLGYSPNSLLEPTCGEGNFISAAVEIFPSLKKIYGFEINEEYIQSSTKKFTGDSRIKLERADFFTNNWTSILNELIDPLLIIGNPPWVTNSKLSMIDSKNLPPKGNFQNHSGLDAITGSSNFDISEWMILEMLDWVRNKNTIIAMLCKTTVARKVIFQEWKKNSKSGKAKIFLIDASSIFNASVDACLLVYDTMEKYFKTCDVFKDLSLDYKADSFGYEDNQLISKPTLYKKWKHLQKNQNNKEYNWRSGIKHDCSPILELRRHDEYFTNGIHQRVRIENTYVYPLLKSSDVANNNSPNRFILVTQKQVGQETKFIKEIAPKTWEYLSINQAYFDKRKSSIYKGKPQFSIFGVGDYSFQPWKIAISGLYKKLHFSLIGPFNNKPVILDDTCYFLSFNNSEEAELIYSLLNSQQAHEFLTSFIFWDAKRPITAKILNKLDVFSLAQEINSYSIDDLAISPKQLSLLERRASYK